MAAILGGVMRVPFTAVIFALELTRDVNALLPLLIASVSAYGFTVLVMKRSILTEKVARRGFHVLREYSVDLLEKNHVEDVMTRKVRTIREDFQAEKIAPLYFHGRLTHHGYPVVDKDAHLLGIITRQDLSMARGRGQKAHDLMSWKLVVAHPHETCRAAATRMARHHIGRLPVVDEKKPHRLLGIVTRSDLIKPNVAHFEEEEVREKPIELEFPRLPGIGVEKKG
jgi:CBS-domain-containing membrane protein